MTGSRIVDSIDPSGNGLIDHYQHVEGGMPTEIQSPQQEIQRENYRYHIPHGYFVQFYLKGHF